MKADFLIVGQGLAGSLLAWSLLKQGASVLVVDNHHKKSASKVAAGIINPVTGPRIVPSWRLEPLLAEARHGYRELEKELDVRVFTEREIIRFFTSNEERMLWMKKRSGSGTIKYLGSMRPPGWKPDVIDDPYGSFSPGGSCHLDMPSLIARLKEFFEERDVLAQTALNYNDLKIREDSVAWNECEVSRVIFCEGFQGQDNPWFDWLPFKNAKGEILTLKSDNTSLPKQILNRGKWLLPMGDGSYKAGSTYGWDTLDCEPTETGKTEVLEGIQAFVRSSFEVAQHEAGVRPIIKDYRPVMGMHPGQPRLGIFNGFGSKGALMIPGFAKHFAAVLTEGAEMDEEVSLKRFTTR